MPGKRTTWITAGVLFILLAFVRTVTDATPLTSSSTVGTAIRATMPILLAGMAGLWAERAGVINIGIEGMMILGTWFGGWAAWQWGPWVGLIMAIIGGMIGGLVHAVAVVRFNIDHIISGVAINILASGLTVVLGIALFSQGGRTPILGKTERFGPLDLPLSETMAGVPIIGPLYQELISGHTIPVYLAILAVPLIWWLLYRTTFGLRLRAVGEMPAAVDSAGVSVTWLRYRAVLIAGLLCGIGGAYLSTAHGAGSVRVEIQDTDGNPLKGYTLDDCPEIYGDAIRYTVRWKQTGGDVRPLSGKPVRLRFVLKDADLYAFGFVPYAPDPDRPDRVVGTKPGK